MAGTISIHNPGPRPEVVLITGAGKQAAMSESGIVHFVSWQITFSPMESLCCDADDRGIGGSSGNFTKGQTLISSKINPMLRGYSAAQGIAQKGLADWTQ